MDVCRHDSCGWLHPLSMHSMYGAGVSMYLSLYAHVLPRFLWVFPWVICCVRRVCNSLCESLTHSPSAYLRGDSQSRALCVVRCALCVVRFCAVLGPAVYGLILASQPQIIHPNGATSGFEMWFALGSHHLWCRGSQPKHVSNPAERILSHILFMT